MASLDEFTTVLAATGPAWATGAYDVVNEVSLNTYTLPHLLANKTAEETVQGGDQITDMIYLDLKPTYTRREVNPTVSYQNPQTGTIWRVPWSFAMAHVAWTKEEVGLNKETYTTKYRAQKYKDVIWLKYQNLWTDVCNGMEAEFWAPPDYGTMEADTVVGNIRVPYSIPTFVNQYPNGVPTLGWTGSNIMGIDAAANVKWRPQQVSYNTKAGSEGTDNLFYLFDAFAKMRQQVGFDKLPRHSEYAEGKTMPQAIFCSDWGERLYQRGLMENQDLFSGYGGEVRNDPAYPGPAYYGIPLVRLSTLNTATLYPGDTGYTAYQDEQFTTGIAIAGPRYYWINGEYLKLVVHSENYASLSAPFIPSAQPFSVVRVMDLWNNNICRSRRRHGIVYPVTTDVTKAL